jgi:ribosomal protein L11 methyltransferase
MQLAPLRAAAALRRAARRAAACATTCRAAPPQPAAAPPPARRSLPPTTRRAAAAPRTHLPTITLHTPTRRGVAASAAGGANTPSDAAAAAPAPALLRVRLLRVPGADVDALSDVLLGCGALSVSVEDAAAGTASESALYLENIAASGPGGATTWNVCVVTALFTDLAAWHDAAAEASSALGGRDLLSDNAADVALDNALDEDWEAAIKAEYRPTQVTPGSESSKAVWIIPDWCTSPDPSAVNIILEPGLAFGTGEHPTTRLCLTWLSESIKGGECVMDYGAGSGVLALGALRLGAACACATDVDALAVGACLSNAALNGVPAGSKILQSAQVGASLSDALPLWALPLPSRDASDAEKTATSSGTAGGAFDVVVANILLNPLLDLEPRLAWYAAGGARLALSGLLASQAPVVMAAYATHFEQMSVRTEGEWALVTGVRNGVAASPGGGGSA